MILVTGGTGLVGSHLLYHLVLENDKIRAIYRKKATLEKVKKVFSFYTDNANVLFQKIEWVKADITSVPSMIPVFSGIKKVYHCAALISFKPEDYIEMRKVNIHGTAIIVNLSIDAKIEKLCFVSSIAAIGKPIDTSMITEENEWDNQADNYGYAITKNGAEMEVWRGSQEGIDVVVVNPGVILGSGFWQTGSGKIIDKVYKGFPFYTKGVTGFIGVKDVVKSMLFLMNSPIKNERFILVSENKSWKDVLFLIADAFSKKRPVLKVGSWLLGVLWRMNWVLSKTVRVPSFFTKHTAKNSQTISLYTTEKIKAQIPFQFQKIGKVVEEVCEEYRKDLL